MRLPVIILFSLVMVLSGINANAKDIEQWSPTETELPLLPAYCQAKFKAREDKNNNDAVKWSRKLGKPWEHIHHYCAAINFMNRASKAWNDREERKFNLNRADTNLEYMVTHTDESFVLLPDVYFRRGEVQRMRQDYAAAAVEYNKAIELNPKYTKPYKSLSDIYRKSHDYDKAIEIIKNGLKQNPKSKSLERYMSELEKLKTDKSNTVENASEDAVVPGNEKENDNTDDDNKANKKDNINE